MSDWGEPIEYAPESAWQDIRAWWVRRDAQERQALLVMGLSVFVAAVQLLSNRPARLPRA